MQGLWLAAENILSTIVLPPAIDDAGGAGSKNYDYSQVRSSSALVYNSLHTVHRPIICPVLLERTGQWLPSVFCFMSRFALARRYTLSLPG